jgi:hypothetical protein
MRQVIIRVLARAVTPGVEVADMSQERMPVRVGTKTAEIMNLEARAKASTVVVAVQVVILQVSIPRVIRMKRVAIMASAGPAVASRVAVIGMCLPVLKDPKHQLTAKGAVHAMAAATKRNLVRKAGHLLGRKKAYHISNWGV